MIPRLLTAFICSLMIVHQATADHMLGGSITYTCVGGNMYNVRLSLTHGCSGAAMTPQTLHFSNTCGTHFSLNNLSPISIESISSVCDAQAVNSSCLGGTLPDFVLYTYESQIFMSPCGIWTIFWNSCCRQDMNNINGVPGLYIETRFFPLTEPCFTSPIFKQNNTPTVCLGQPVAYDAGAFSAGGHRLEYSFIAARYADPTPVPVNYSSPNHGGEPVAGMTIDHMTGVISFIPQEQGYVVVVVKVEAFNEADELTGWVMRDLSFLVIPCSNTPPLFDSGNIIGVEGNIFSDGDRSLQACASGASGCATIAFNDVDPGQQLTAASNFTSLFPGATIEFVGNELLTATLCWNDAAPVPGIHHFVITVTDDACPYTASQAYTYTITVDTLSISGSDGSAMTCVNMPFVMVDSLQGVPVAGGSWYDPSGEIHSGIFNGSIDPPGVYTYVAHCQMTAVLDVTLLDGTHPQCILMEVAEPGEEVIGIQPNPSAGMFQLTGVRAEDRVELLDAMGRVVHQPGSAGSQDSWAIELPASLINGSYVVRVHRHGSAVMPFRLLLIR